MIRVCPLFSGSSGNSTYVGISESEGFLVDVGKSTKQIEKSLLNNNIDINNIKGLFITHEHSDHVAGLRVFSAKYGIKIYASEGTVGALKSKGIIGESQEFEIMDSSGKDLEIAFVRPFSTSHDCTEGCGYSFTTKSGQKISVCTDLGYLSDSVKEVIYGSESIVIESNHDVDMLKNGPYPYYLKRRILSDKGHLSNDMCSDFLPDLINRGTKNIILAHLSQHNNTPDLAYQTAICSLSQKGIKEKKDFNLFVAPKINENSVDVVY